MPDRPAAAGAAAGAACGDPAPAPVLLLPVLPLADIVWLVGVAGPGPSVAWWIVDDVVELVWDGCDGALPDAVGGPPVLVGCAPTDSVVATAASGAGVGALLDAGAAGVDVAGAPPEAVEAVPDEGCALPLVPVVPAPAEASELGPALGVGEPVVLEPVLAPELEELVPVAPLEPEPLPVLVVGALDEPPVLVPAALPALGPEGSVVLVEEVPPVVSVDEVPPVVSVDEVPPVVSVEDVVAPPAGSVDELPVFDCEVDAVALGLLVSARAVAASQHIATATIAISASVLAQRTPRGRRSVTGP